MSITFKTILEEGFKNLFSKKEKERYAEEVFNLLSQSYAKIGGLQGSGFESAEAIIQAVPFWKLSFVSGNLVAVIMYKDTQGRKLVALGTDGSMIGKAKVKEIMQAEFARSYMEISGPLLAFVQKTLPELYIKYRIPSSEVSDIIGKEVKPIDEYFYSRELGGTEHVKLLIGTPGKGIK